MCGGAVGSLLDKTGLVDKAQTPVVVASNPAADAKAAEAKAAQTAAADKLATNRRRRAASLLATGGAGDPTQPMTAAPAATAGKPTLGA
jgi:hypothetical protein